MEETSAESLKSFLANELKVSIERATPDITLMWREMDCCALLDVWDLLYRNSSEPLWRDLWLAERSSFGDVKEVFLAGDHVAEVDLLTEAEKKEAVEVIFDSFVRMRKTVIPDCLNEWAESTGSEAFLRGVGAVEFLTARAYRNSMQFPNAAQFEEYLLQLSQIHGFLCYGTQGNQLACRIYFDVVRNKKSSIPPAWRRLYLVISKKVYWDRVEKRKASGKSTTWHVERFVDSMKKILLLKGIR